MEITNFPLDLDFTDYKARNVKIFNGPSCPGYTADLYRGDKLVARILDEGKTEEVTLDWLDTEDVVQIKVNETHLGTKEQEMYEKEVYVLPPIELPIDGKDTMTDYTNSLFAALLVTVELKNTGRLDNYKRMCG